MAVTSSLLMTNRMQCGGRDHWQSRSRPAHRAASQNAASKMPVSRQRFWRRCVWTGTATGVWCGHGAAIDCPFSQASVRRAGSAMCKVQVDHTRIVTWVLELCSAGCALAAPCSSKLAHGASAGRASGRPLARTVAARVELGRQRRPDVRTQFCKRGFWNTEKRSWPKLKRWPSTSVQSACSHTCGFRIASASAARWRRMQPASVIVSGALRARFVRARRARARPRKPLRKPCRPHADERPRVQFFARPLQSARRPAPSHNIAAVV